MTEGDHPMLCIRLNLFRAYACCPPPPPAPLVGWCTLLAVVECSAALMQQVAISHGKDLTPRQLRAIGKSPPVAQPMER